MKVHIKLHYVIATMVALDIVGHIMNLIFTLKMLGVTLWVHNIYQLMV